MASPINKVSITLNGGIDERSESELTAPVAAQGASLTLKVSQNTRLSEAGGTTVRPPAATYGGVGVGTGQRIRSITAAESGKASLALMVPGYNERIGEDGTLTGNGSGTYPSTPGATPGDSFLPGLITDAGASPGKPGYGRIASVVATDAFSGQKYIYHAYTVYVGILFTPELTYSLDVVAYITDLEGAIIATPRTVATQVQMGRPDLFLTTHSGGQVNVWYDNAANNIATFTLSHTGNNQLAYGSSATVAIPTDSASFAVVGGMYLDYAGAQVTTYQQYAYLAVFSPLLGNVQVHRVDVSAAYAVTSAVVNADASSYLMCSIAFYQGTVGVAAQGDTTLYARTYTSALVLVTSTNSATPGCLGENPSVACGFYAASGTTKLIIANGNAPSATYRRTSVSSLSTTVSAITAMVSLPWMANVAQASQMTLRTGTGALETYPVFALVRNYGLAFGPQDETYVSDPDIQLWVCRDGLNVAPAARYGTVRGTAAPAELLLDTTTNGPLFLGNLRLHHIYLKADLASLPDRPSRTSRWVLLDFSPAQFRGAADRDGSTLVAASLPYEWDSVVASELGGPLYIPKLTNTVAGGGTITAGDYTAAAVYSWTDAAGKKHRSSPGFTTLTIPPTGSFEIIVASPTAHLRGTPDNRTLECELYVSSATSTTLTRQSPTVTLQDYGWNLYLTALTEDLAQIYSAGDAGEEQTPQPPPPLSDITIIGDRAWGIDAEMPSRLVHSKRRVAGIGYEWYPGYEILLPSGAGDALAIREWQGAVVVFARNAIFIVSGDGPDNLVGNPSGGGFSKPQKVSDLGVSVAASVLATPAGIVFQRDQDMMLFQGGAPKYMPGPVATETCVGATLFRDADEAVFFFASRQLVWNYDAGKWTTWTLKNNASATLAAGAIAPVTYDQDRVMVVDRTSTVDAVYVIDSNVLGNLPMSWETDWVLLGGDFQDHVLLQHLVFSAKSEGAHGVTIEVFTNYETSASTTRTYSAAEITAITTNGRYTLKVQPTNRGTRAAKVRLTETTPTAGLGMRPIALTLYHNLEASLMEPAIRPGAFK